MQVIRSFPGWASICNKWYSIQDVRLSPSLLYFSSSIGSWKAFIYYTYTNEIQFNELKSQQNQVSVHPCSIDESNNISCSPKSMYRFAKSVSILLFYKSTMLTSSFFPGQHSMSRIYSEVRHLKGLTQENIIHELFSAFTSR